MREALPDRPVGGWWAGAGTVSLSWDRLRIGEGSRGRVGTLTVNSFDDGAELGMGGWDGRRWVGAKCISTDSSDASDLVLSTETGRLATRIG